MAAYNFLSFA